MILDLNAIRSHFPSLSRPAIFFDNPGGTQIAKPSLDRINRYLLECNTNHGGAFSASIQSDAILEEAHLAMADFYNASGPDEIIFGSNMTTLTLHLSRSIARTWQPGDEIVLTRLDHDANVTPWALAAADRGCKVIWVDFHPDNGTLNMEEMRTALERKPRFVAAGYASNALGTINPVDEIIRMAHKAGAWVYIDAVQFAPHGPIDVQALDCDFLVSSSYKYYGPHAGILYGKRAILNELMAYKVRPASSELPGKFETGTQNHEGIAGVLGTIEYFEWIGEQFGSPFEPQFAGAGFSGRRLALKKALAAIFAYDQELNQALLETLQSIRGLKLYGLQDPNRMHERVPTFSFRLRDLPPRVVAGKLAKEEIYAWDGNYYAINVTERLGLEASGGMVRVGATHYNTLSEVERLGQALSRITG